MKALILSGGANKGAYEIGAVKWLIEQGHEFDIICGSSVGALNGAFLAQYPKNKINIGIDDLIKFWRNLKQEDVYKRWFLFGRAAALWKKSLYNSEPLYNTVSNTIDENKLISSGIQLRIGTVSVNTGKYKISNQYDPFIYKTITASASFPPYFYPVKINNEYEYDAGVREYTPINSAIQVGATEMYVICTSNLNLDYVNPEKFKTFDLFKRCISTIAVEAFVNDIKEIDYINKSILNNTCTDPNKRLIKSYLMAPQETLISDSFEFNQKIINHLIEKGYNDARKQFASK